MRLTDGNNIDIAVKSAVEGEVRHLRINPVVLAVVNRYSDYIVIGERVCDIDTPGGIAAVVVCKLCSVDKDIGGGVCAAQLKIISVRVR